MSIWAVLRAPSVEIAEPQALNDATADSISNEEPLDQAELQDTQPVPGTGDDDVSTSVVESLTDGAGPQPSLDADLPLLGADVDYRLLMSTTGRPAILDLNSGAVTYTEGSSVSPVAISGGWLVVESAAPAGLARLPIDDLGTEPVGLLEGQDVVFTNVFPTMGPASPGQLWVVAYRHLDGDDSNIQPSAQLIDLSSGTVVDHPAAGDGLPLTDFFGGRFSDENGALVTSPAGGIYASTPDGLRLAVDGRLITADQTKALVEQCDTTFICRKRWLDRSTWQPLDLAVPSGPEPIVVALPGTDWVFTSALSDTGPTNLFNTRTSETVSLRIPETLNSLVLPAVSPDGQWLAETGQDRTLILRNLTNGETKTVTLDEPVSSPLMFIRN